MPRSAAAAAGDPDEVRLSFVDDNDIEEGKVARGDDNGVGIVSPLRDGAGTVDEDATRMLRRIGGNAAVTQLGRVSVSVTKEGD
eukprot:CAMPEP_0197594626 /NCGR_PEP_ID=MMETSP1326-20131121/21041_1 /TAXON_ID=1155430 /ORGANISM="Genus nov. species nov., Strain RCC2288" /LENGTH=83 /DNA_ID=CAMNT_0043160851 /DNA_START=136 /DNA_END=384 /DNA_ORIENTATION=+